MISLFIINYRLYSATEVMMLTLIGKPMDLVTLACFDTKHLYHPEIIHLVFYYLPGLLLRILCRLLENGNWLNKSNYLHNFWLYNWQWLIGTYILKLPTRIYEVSDGWSIEQPYKFLSHLRQLRFGILKRSINSIKNGMLVTYFHAHTLV